MKIRYLLRDRVTGRYYSRTQWDKLHKPETWTGMKETATSTTAWDAEKKYHNVALVAPGRVERVTDIEKGESKR